MLSHLNAEFPAGGKRGSEAKDLCSWCRTDLWFSVLGWWPFSASTNHKVLLCSTAHTHAAGCVSSFTEAQEILGAEGLGH